MRMPSPIQSYAPVQQPQAQQYSTNNIWTPPGNGYPPPTKNEAYRGGQGLSKKQKKPNNWCWTHRITYHDSVNCKKPENGHQNTATVTNMLGSQLCGIV